MMFDVTPFWWGVFIIGMVVIGAGGVVVFLTSLWKQRERKDGLR
jgi:hypothetical protein